MTSYQLVKYTRGVRWLALTLPVVFGLQLTGPASSHDPGTARDATEARVFDFYQTWFRPPERTYSCCNMQDCHVVDVRREGDRWYFLDKISYGAPTWRAIPPDRLEHNASDSRESPDGQSHVCFNSMYVLCAVLGSGQ